MRIKLLALLICMTTQTAAALTIGPVGKTYPIIENDLLEMIHEKLQQKQKNGDVKMLKNTIDLKTKKYLDTPNNGPDLPRAKSTKEWTYSDSFVVKQDMHDANGNSLFKKGERVDLSHVAETSFTYLFINGDDVEQREFAQYYLSNNRLKEVRIILTAGSIEDATRAFNQKVFFDQHGKLVTNYDIHALPAIVETRAKRLRVTEVGWL